jgi:hypothetical protein
MPNCRTRPPVPVCLGTKPIHAANSRALLGAADLSGRTMMAWPPAACDDAPMKQTSFASLEYAGKKRKTRREKFLGEMELVVPWAALMALIEPHYPKSGRVGRPPIGLARMLRMYFLQQWYSLSDEGLEDALYDSQAMREFVGFDLAREQVPDATTLLKFRRLLEQHELTKAIFEQVNAHLGERGLLMREGTLVDATIIAAPSSIHPSDSMPPPCTGDNLEAVHGALFDQSLGSLACASRSPAFRYVPACF